MQRTFWVLVREYRANRKHYQEITDKVAAGRIELEDGLAQLKKLDTIEDRLFAEFATVKS